MSRRRARPLRKVALALVLAALGGGAWTVVRYFPEYLEYLPWRSKPEPAAVVTPDLPLGTPAAERLARIEERLRLPPDQRAIASIGEIRRIARGGASAEADVRYVAGSWKVSFEGESLGVLSPFPRFSALLALLDEFAARERGRAGAVRLADDPAIRPELLALLNRFDDEADFTLLAQVDALWAERKASVGDLLAAAEALAQLCLILPSDFPAADRLAARALASLALARQVAPERALRAEVMLSYALGYVEHAAALADRLPRGEPLGFYVRREFGALERMAEWSKSGDVHFYYGARAVWARSDVGWIVWYRSLPPEQALRTAIVRTALDERSAALGDFVPELYATVLLARFGISPPKSEPAEAALTHCDALAGKLAESARALRGPFADAPLYQGSYRSACLSALYRKLVFLADVKSEPDAALALARSGPKSPSPDLAALRDWAEGVAGAGARDPSAAARLAKAVATPGLGREERVTLARRAIDALPADDPRRCDVADALSRWLDSRAADRAVAADLAREVYLDPDLEERLSAATLDVDRLERPLLAARLAGLRRDWRALWSLAELDGYRLPERMAALQKLEQQKPLEPQRLRRAYERLLTANTDSEPLRRQFAKYLEKGLHNRKAAREVLLPILTAHESQDAPSDSAAGIIARLYREEGNPSAAWQLLEPRLAGMRVPYEATRAQVALGDLARAEEIARAAYAHYPQSLAPAAELAAVLWEAKRNAEAAEVIAKFPAPAPDTERCYHFCRAFVRTFREKTPDEAEAAFREMIAAGIPDRLLEDVIAMFRDTGEAETAPATALALGELMQTADRNLAACTESYETLKAMRGSAEALAWITERIPRRQLAAAAPIFYERGADELLWTLVDDPDHQGGPATWLLRAAAYAREKHPLVSHQQALAAYFGAHRETAEERLGAALVGLIDETALLASVRTEAELGKAAWALGARDESLRDYRGAMRMYQLARTSLQATDARARAVAAATRIHGLGTSLDALEAEPSLAAVVAAVP